MNNQNPTIIVALDFDRRQEAETLVAQLDPSLCRLKVGKEMFTHFGPDFVEYLVKKNFSVFLDLKFHDIPNTVKKACLAAAELGVWMINVHCSGGQKMMEESAQALARLGPERPLLTGVTVLTSMSEREFALLGMQRTLSEQVVALAELAKQSGLDGVVCSAHEAGELKQRLGKGFKLVTPGIRPAGVDADDQTRIMTPQQAISAGSDYLVIGRPITQAAQPLNALINIVNSVG